MFQATIAVIHHVQHEHIAVMRHLGLFARLLAGAPETDFCFANSAAVSQQPFTVKTGRGARHHQLVRHTTGLEVTLPEVADLDRAIHQFVIVGRAVSAKAVRVDFVWCQSRGNLPCGGGLDGQQVKFMDSLGLPSHLQQQASAIEKASLRIKPATAYGVVKGVDLITQLQRLACFAVHFPTVFIELAHSQGRLALPCLQSRQVSRKVAHQVAARYPCRQAHALRGDGAGDAQGDSKGMCMKAGNAHLVVDGGGITGRLPGNDGAGGFGHGATASR